MRTIKARYALVFLSHSLFHEVELRPGKLEIESRLKSIINQKMKLANCYTTNSRMRLICLNLCR